MSATERDFYPRPPGGGRQQARRNAPQRSAISIHALRVEGDAKAWQTLHQTLRFLSTPSGWRATLSVTHRAFASTFLSTPSGWRATKDLIRAKLEQIISIHALRVEGDGQDVRALADIIIFLSTPSGWRATWDAGRLQQGKNHFYPRPPGGGRPVSAGTEGIDPAISIHALRVEGDDRKRGTHTNGEDFYPRPPGGGRHCGGDHAEMEGTIFLSTPSGWRATRRQRPPMPEHPISIHALRVEGDCAAEDVDSAYGGFLSTPSGWRATCELFGYRSHNRFLSTPSGWRATSMVNWSP